ncbi:protein ANTAGONIST OF LIKE HETEROCHROMATIN PROTEIN 1-like [Pecten maximus]|uniref:protein ANTAGONIST OF LIKE HETEROCHROMATIN PROTEIN 1-like n=1 Tax=Pecten maximus TaxID=6579 RepID=UPI001458C368|nr:protein ANTAGONIST OF LIKE HETEROCHROMATIN PROTEIN 1-like [Pecten maximus]
MANTESMREIGQYFGIGKSTVHITLERVTEAVIDHFLKVIKWPDFPTQLQIAQDIHLRYGLPDIVGYLDGTHIRLSGCPKGDKDYINRKSYPSIQLQVVVDQDLLITNCYTGWAGCAHDARVLRNSTLYEKAEAGGYIIPGKVIVADSAYPLKDWLVTPFKDNGHLNHNQRRFNRILSSGRQIVERAIGHLKGRFRRLQEITVHEPRLIVSLITCGCIMHNLCILSHENLDTYMNYDDDNNHPNNFPNIFQNDVGGVARRQILMNAMN